MKQTYMNWETIIVTFLTSNVVIALIELARFLLDRKQKKTKEGRVFSKALLDIHHVYDAINRIQEKTGAARVSIFKITDSGNVPAVDVPLYTSVLYEVANHPTEPLKDEIQDVRVGEVFVDVLKNLSIQKSATLQTNLLKDSSLKDILLSTNISTTVLYEIASWEDTMVVLSIEFIDQLQPDARFRNVVRLTLNQIKRIFENKDLV
jgi:hypothetical protein